MLRRILKTIRFILRTPPWMWRWAPTLAALPPFEELGKPDEEGFTYAAPRPEFLDDTPEDSREYSRRLRWAKENGLIETKEAKYGVMNRVNDPQWWWKAGAALVHRRRPRPGRSR